MKMKNSRVKVRGDMAQGQRSFAKPNKGSYQKVEGYRIWVKGHKGLSQVMVPNKGRWTHINVKLLHLPGDLDL